MYLKFIQTLHNLKNLDKTQRKLTFKDEQLEK